MNQSLLMKPRHGKKGFHGTTEPTAHCGGCAAHATHGRHAHASQGAMPLALARPGTPVRIAAIGGRDETRTFLSNLGFVEGCEVSVVCESGGNLIVDAKGARVALSRQMAGRVMVF